MSGGSKIVLVYDLEKVFDTPKLSTNVIYYKRQLSTYNLCIHDETNNRSYMYIWHEGIASKGPQEITSGLLYHFNNFVPANCHKIILYSDGCGSQNRNIKTSLMLDQYLEKSNNLETIEQNFFMSGHSYNVCDRKFGIIEKKKRRTTNIFVPSQWKDLIADAKVTLPKFIVTELGKESFVSCQKLQEICTNRKKTTDNEIVSWLKTHKITYKRGQPLLLFLEYYSDIDLKYSDTLENQIDVSKTLSIGKKGFICDDFKAAELPVLYPHGRPITADKKKDLLEILIYIPQEFHHFYVDLRHESEPAYGDDD